MTNSTQKAAPVTNNLWSQALKQALAAMGLASVCLVAVYAIGFFSFHPEFDGFHQSDVNTAVIPGKNFRPVAVGGGRLNGDSVVISDFLGEQAVISTAARFYAEDFPFIKFNIEGLTRFTRAYVYWRLAAEPDKLYQIPLNRSGDQVTQIAMVYGEENYRGLIEELAIGFIDGPALGFSNNNDVEIVVHSVELRPFSGSRVVEQIWEDWTNPPLWQGYSNNYVRGIHGSGILFPNLVLNLLVATTVVFLIIFRFSHLPRLLGKVSIARAALVTIVVCWLLGDVLRWQWRIEQLRDTHERYAGLPLEQRIRNNPIRCERFPKDCRADLLPYF